jgi:hypothetical protein
MTQPISQATRKRILDMAFEVSLQNDPDSYAAAMRVMAKISQIPVRD